MLKDDDVVQIQSESVYPAIKKEENTGEWQIDRAIAQIRSDYGSNNSRVSLVGMKRGAAQRDELLDWQPAKKIVKIVEKVESVNSSSSSSDSDIEVESKPVPKITQNRKRNIKERSKELEKLKQTIVDSSSDSDSSSSSEWAKPQSFKITVPKPTLNIKTSIQRFKDKKSSQKVPKNQQYLNQFSVLPKSKMSSKEQESIVSSHLTSIRPGLKPLKKGVKVTPDYYSVRRRDSNGNRTFDVKDKIAKAKQGELQQQAKDQGKLFLQNDKGEDISVDADKDYQLIIADDLCQDQQIVLKAVILDPIKARPFDTGYFMAQVLEVGDQEVFVKVREDFWNKFAYDKDQDEGMILEDGTMEIQKSSIHEVYCKNAKSQSKPSSLPVTNPEPNPNEEQVAKKKVENPESNNSNIIYRPKQTPEKKKEIISSFLQNQRKGLIKRIGTQMDFYFSEKNLKKDDFLKKKIKEDSEGWIPLLVFMTFNKLITMGASEELIKESIPNCKNCQLNADLSAVKKI